MLSRQKQHVSQSPKFSSLFFSPSSFPFFTFSFTLPASLSIYICSSLCGSFFVSICLCISLTVIATMQDAKMNLLWSLTSGRSQIQEEEGQVDNKLEDYVICLGNSYTYTWMNWYERNMQNYSRHTEKEGINFVWINWKAEGNFLQRRHLFWLWRMGSSL